MDKFLAAGRWFLYALRATAWALLLAAWIRLWGGLGGLVDERIRWAAEWIVPGAAVFGWMAGAWAGPASEEVRRRRRRSRIWLPILGMLLIAGWLWSSSQFDAITVAGACGLAWFAGWDIVRTVGPQMDRQLRFRTFPATIRFPARKEKS
jgi:hypothetical protein